MAQAIETTAAAMDIGDGLKLEASGAVTCDTQPRCRGRREGA